MANILLQQTLLIALMIIGSFVTIWVFKKFFIPGISSLILRSQTKWDDILVEHKIFDQLAYIAPIFVIYELSEYLIFGNLFIRKALATWVTIRSVFLLQKVVDIFYTVYEKLPSEKPKMNYKGFIQLIKIVFFLLGMLVIFSIALEQSPMALLSGIGAMTAILLLIFRDTILAFVASIQINIYQTLSIGDWIEMKEYSADGDVIDINLHTIQVQNWNKSIVNIPTHKLLEHPFTNWKGMFLSNGRRIKRAVSIDISSIALVTPEMLENYKATPFLEPFISTIEKEIAQDLQNLNTSHLLTLGDTPLTNIRLFREYLKSHFYQKSEINTNLTFMIRQLKPTSEGLPLEIYLFTKDTRWTTHEEVQSNIFEYVLAVMSYFELEAFQKPSGKDWQTLQTNKIEE